MVDMRNQGLSQKQVAAELGLPVHRVQRSLKKVGYLGRPFPLSNPRFTTPEQLEQSRRKHNARSKRWRDSNPELAREQDRRGSRRRLQNKKHVLIKNLRKRVADAVKGNIKAGRTLELCGCTADFLVNHIEAQFQPGMTWDNYGVFGWHIDHIVSCWRFDLTDPEQQKQCFHYSNLQPLWREDNLAKRDHWEAA